MATASFRLSAHPVAGPATVALSLSAAAAALAPMATPMIPELASTRSLGSSRAPWEALRR